jgi:glycosyltransferase involved in cell wall biosynthesis
MSKPLVEVLMSTYDGAPYVREQVESVLRQTEASLRLLVRDDGSADDTVALIREVDDPRIVVREGENTGLPAAFFRLLDESSDDVEFWSLCDQDDVWEPDKIARAVEALRPLGDGPALYCARVLVVDEDLGPLYPHELPRRGPSFANALVQNIALGCTVVLNRPARELLRGRWPRECVMHDAWMYLVIAGTGTVVYDESLVVRYRQHGRNSVGMGRGPFSRFAGRVRRQLSPGGPRKHSRQDRELLRLFADDLKPEALGQLQGLLDVASSPVRRVVYALRGPVHRQTRGSDLVLKALQIAGRL